jgi:uncharacterized NAD(P)/FAD-binding protein YdhS
MPASSLSVAVIGGGASGVLMAAHLLRSGEPNLQVTIVERHTSLGRGLAYSTGSPDHLLNVRASNMSAFADDPDHFVRWLHTREINTGDPTTYFAPRRLYGEYLGHLLRDVQAVSGPLKRLRIVDEECVEVVQRQEYLELRLANGSSIVAQHCVLATGHDDNPYRAATPPMPREVREAAPLDPADAVLIMGTGLSMVDACQSLLLQGHAGPIFAVSRRGLLPTVHRKTVPIIIQNADVPLGSGLLEFVRWFRELVRSTEACGGDWRDAVDGLRPHSQAIWRNWSATSKRQFLRHAKAWWDIHRHRMAPQIHERLSWAIAIGQLRVIAGRLLDVKAAAKGFDVKLQLRNDRSVEEIPVARIYDCAGVIADPAKSSNPAIQSLLASGTARPDPLHIGLDVSAEGALIGQDGRESERIYAVGPLTRGTFLEIEAVPDIRVQCQRLSATLMSQTSSA